MQLQEWKSRVGVVFGCADVGSKYTLHPIRPTHENTPDPPQKEKQETAPPLIRGALLSLYRFNKVWIYTGKFIYWLKWVTNS